MDVKQIATAAANVTNKAIKLDCSKNPRMARATVMPSAGGSRQLALLMQDGRWQHFGRILHSSRSSAGFELDFQGSLQAMGQSKAGACFLKLLCKSSLPSFHSALVFLFFVLDICKVPAQKSLAKNSFCQFCRVQCGVQNEDLQSSFKKQAPGMHNINDSCQRQCFNSEIPPWKSNH